MSALHDERRERLEELLADAAVGPLSSEEREELATLSREFPDLDAESFEAAAAAIHLAASESTTQEPMPAALRNRILREAPRILAHAELPVSLRQPLDTVPHHRRDWRVWSGWLAAAALVVVFASLQIPSVGRPAAKAISLKQQRDDLFSQPGTILAKWTPGPHPFPAPVAGDVLWNQARQKGFLSFQGMPVNDPAKQQYQLWIIDPQRDKHPIDGGVFDITREGELVIVPIVAKLQVIDPQAFAITVEKSGGVVVSDQQQLVVLAQNP